MYGLLAYICMHCGVACKSRRGAYVMLRGTRKDKEKPRPRLCLRWRSQSRSRSGCFSIVSLGFTPPAPHLLRVAWACYLVRSATPFGVLLPLLHFAPLFQVPSHAKPVQAPIARRALAQAFATPKGPKTVLQLGRKRHTLQQQKLRGAHMEDTDGRLDEETRTLHHRKRQITRQPRRLAGPRLFFPRRRLPCRRLPLRRRPRARPPC